MKHRFAAQGIVVLFVAAVTCADAFADDARVVRHAAQVARELFQSDNYYDQISGAGILVDIGDAAALEYLLNMLEHPDHSFKRAVIDVLLSVQHPTGIDAVQRLASNGADGAFVKFLSESLASRPYDAVADSILIQLMLDALVLDDVWIKKHMLQALAHAPLSGHEARILEIAEDETQDPISRAYANVALLNTSDQARSLNRLIELSVDGSLEAKEAAAIAFGQVDNERTRAALRKMHAETNPFVKLAVLTSEAGFGEDQAIVGLTQIIINGGTLDGPAAAASLRRLPPAVAVQISQEVISCCDLGGDAAARLVESWAWIDAAPSRIYEWGLSHEDADVRMQTVWLLGQRGERAYLEMLNALLEDQDNGIRAMAAWSIVRMLADVYSAGTET